MSRQNNSSGDVPEKKRFSKKGWVLLISVLLLIFLPITALAVYVSNYSDIFPNIYVGDISLSGKSPDEAYALLTETYRADVLAGQTLVLNCEENTREIPATDLAIQYQNKETVDEALAMGNTGNPVLSSIRFVKQLFAPVHIAPAITYDAALLHDVMNELSLPYEVEPVNFTFEIAKDEVTIHAPVAGVKIDRDAICSEIEDNIRRLSLNPVTMELKTTPAEELDFESFYEWLTSPAENATYYKDENGTIQVQREKLQCTVDKDIVKAAIATIEQSENDRATFQVTTTEPEVLSLTLKDTLYKDKLGSYTTYYNGTYARNNNVQLAASRINGYELMPGEEFSYDKTILPRTAENGYMAAPVYVGNKVESGMGGGICQPSSTLYGAALYANLEILERHNHSMLVSYMPAGLDATISQGALDLRLRNNTPYPVKIASQASGGVLTFSIWGYNPENISVNIVRSGSEYQYYATRIVMKDGVEISRESLSSSRYVPPAPTPEPSASPEPEATPEPENGSTETPSPTSETENTPGGTTMPQAPSAPSVVPTTAPTSSGLTVAD